VYGSFWHFSHADGKQHRGRRALTAEVPNVWQVALTATTAQK
jgi:hypothetical protein